MARWTKEQLDEYLVKHHVFKEDDHEADPGPESKLQSKILEWCRQRGYPVFHDNSRKKNVRGWPDLTIVMEAGRVLFVELKSADGKLRKEQQHQRQVFLWLKHEIHLVRSFKRFLEVVKCQTS